MHQRTILCVSSDQAQSDRNLGALTQAGYAVLGTTLASQAMEMMSFDPIDLLVIDARLPPHNQQKLISSARNRLGIPVVLVVAPQQQRPAKEDGSVQYVPCDDQFSSDRCVEVPDGTEGLLRTVMEILPKYHVASSSR
jgi:DNA-binding NtrC family response regulator